jgi:hypothetical protein
MSSILYYSNFCEHSKKLLQGLSKTNVNKDLHFICIDKRVKEGNKTYIVLESGQKIVLPDTISRVPALLLLNKNYEVLYGEDIVQHLRPQQEVAIRQATQNNMEPTAFSLGGGNFGIVSDNYSFLDMEPADLEAKGNGGLRQMHNYVHLSYQDTIHTPEDEVDFKTANKIPGTLTIEQLQKQREEEFAKLQGKANPYG